MDISKITILPDSVRINKIVFKQPNKDITHSIIINSISTNKDKLPRKLVKKIMKQQNIPEYINQDCFYSSKKNLNYWNCNGYHKKSPLLNNNNN